MILVNNKKLIAYPKEVIIQLINKQHNKVRENFLNIILRETYNNLMIKKCFIIE